MIPTDALRDPWEADLQDESRSPTSVSGRPKERHSGRDVDHNM